MSGSGAPQTPSAPGAQRVLVLDGGTTDEDRRRRAVTTRWLREAGMAATAVEPPSRRRGLPAALAALAATRRPGQLLLVSSALHPAALAALAVRTRARRRVAVVYRALGPPDMPWRAVHVAVARRARVVIAPSLGAALSWGRAGVAYERLHVVPADWPQPDDEAMAEARRVHDTWSARADRGAVVASPSAGAQLAASSDDAGLVTVTTNPHRRADAAARSVVGGLEAPVMQAVLAQATRVVTTADDPDLDPWAAVAAGQRPIVLAEASTPDYLLAPLVERDVATIVCSEDADLTRTLTSSPRPDPERLRRVARGVVSSVAVRPLLVHAVACASDPVPVAGEHPDRGRPAVRP